MEELLKLWGLSLLTVRSLMDPSTKVLVAGFIPKDPEQKTRPPNLVACESGGYGPGALSVVTISRTEFDILFCCTCVQSALLRNKSKIV